MIALDILLKHLSPGEILNQLQVQRLAFGQSSA